MPDIFLSYAREDAAFVERLAAALQTVGYSCWWDRQLVSGARYLAETEAQLQSAKAVVVVWSRTSINSHWVADEAAVGRDGDRLAALSFDGSMPPLGFRQFQVTDFAGWRGGTDEAPFQSLLRGLERSVPVSSEGLGRTASSPPKTSTRPRWWLPTIASVGALLVGAVLWMLLRPAPAPTGNAASAIGSTAGSVGATDFPRDPELRRAVGLAQQVNAIREDVLLAEEIVERAVERAPADPEAVTVMAHIQAYMILRNFEFTAERTAKARRYCERAVALSPQDPVALSALSIFLSYRGNEPERAVRLARQAIDLAPLDPWPRRVLQDVMWLTDKEGAIVTGEENVARFPRDPLVRYQLALAYGDRQRSEDFERALDATIALAPVGNAIDWKARLAMIRGDFPAARGWLERIPERLRSEERTVLTAFTYALLTDDADYGLAALERYPETWFSAAVNYQGPKALLQAILLQRAGRQELARGRFEAALQQIREFRSRRPDDPSTDNVEAFTLIGLGRLPEARAPHRVATQLLSRPVRAPLYWIDVFNPLLRSLLVGDRDGALQLAREYAEDPLSRRAMRERLMLDPRFTPFRNDAQLRTILAEPR